jgi:hypothetical protein
VFSKKETVLDTVGKNISSQRKYCLQMFSSGRLFGSSLELVSKEEKLSDRNAWH